MNRRFSSLSAGRISPFPTTVVLLILMAGLVGGYSLFEEDTVRATVSGEITDEIGVPLVGAIVTVTFSPTSD